MPVILSKSQFFKKKIVQRTGTRRLILRVNLGFESSYSWNHWMEFSLSSQDKMMTKPKFECIIKTSRF